MLVHLTIWLCAALFAVLVYSYDLYDREPWYMVLFALAAGFGVMWLAGGLEDLVLGQLRVGRDEPAKMAIFVALIENAMKLLMVGIIAHSCRKHFNDPLDGVIYGTLGGLGTAIEESMLYVSISPPGLQTVGAEVVRLCFHALVGGIIGFAVGIGARPDVSRQRHWRLVLFCMGVATTVQFTWDFIAYQPEQAAPLRGLFMALVASLMMTWGMMVAYASRRSREVFAGGGGAEA